MSVAAKKENDEFRLEELNEPPHHTYLFSSAKCPYAEPSVSTRDFLLTVNGLVSGTFCLSPDGSHLTHGREYGP